MLVMAEGGVAVFLTFHSGEDRRVKKHFKQGKSSCTHSVSITLIILTLLLTHIHKHTKSIPPIHPFDHCISIILYQDLRRVYTVTGAVRWVVQGRKNDTTILAQSVRN